MNILRLLTSVKINKAQAFQSEGKINVRGISLMACFHCIRNSWKTRCEHVLHLQQIDSFQSDAVRIASYGSAINIVFRTIRATCLMVLMFHMFSLSALAQSASERTVARQFVPLMVGASLPEDFWTKKHLFYIDGKTVCKTLEDYKGKLIILDFWATWCGQCWTQMPLNEQLANSYNGDVIVLLIDTKSTKDTFDKIATTDRKYIKGMGIDRLETIFNDDYFENLFPVSGYPKYMWISPSGYFIAATTRNSVTKGHIDALLDIYKVK